MENEKCESPNWRRSAVPSFGGGGKSGGNVTPSGTYSIVVTASAGPTWHTATYKLTVQ